MIRVLDNNKGFTLIELLASLAILSIIIGLVSSVLINSMNYSERSESKLSLASEANLLLAQLTNYHQSGETYKVSYNSTTTEIKVNDTVVGKPDLQYILVIDQQKYQGLPSSTSSAQSFPDRNIVTYRPLFVELRIIDEKSQQYEVKTVINRK
ncbi:PulJ/GspJ family protein [Litchfieldia salsa]|uniref:Prepilin-type N-terminal cleavage/methylation domain-containing protein n=1 Tax=Litchfieldia salsa TaxID=930152 RepID=A0A1H0NV13_9BACI|nr:type II secretion system protein [Litchfieldia salsa]SDO96366.1 prepilin-type N-terminal cleavage/methylation domain-containing protein [Litchfieldia salsa]